MRMLNNKYGPNLVEETKMWGPIDKNHFDKQVKDVSKKKEHPFNMPKKHKYDSEAWKKVHWVHK